MALEKPRDIYTHDLSTKNLTAGEGSNATKRVDGAFFDANYGDINTALAVRQSWGADWTDEGSDADNGYYGIPAGIVDAEHYVVVSDGTNAWKVKAFADDEIKIDDDDIVNGGAGPADYSDSDFINSLHLWVDKTEKAGVYIDNTQVVLDEDATNALTGDDIPRAAGESDTIDDDLTAVETAFAAEHNAGTGAHEGLASSALAATAFGTEGFKNFVRNGSFERWAQGPNAAPESEGWEADNATVVQETTNVLYGDYSAKITASAASRGIKYTVTNFSDFAGRTVTVSAKVKQSAAGDVLIRIEDGVDSTDGTAVTLSSSWQTVSCTHEVDSSASKLEIYVYSDGGSAGWYLDAVMGVLGDIRKDYDSSTHDDIAEDDVIPVNWLLNPGFEIIDTYGTPTCDDGYGRDYWVKYGLGNLSVSSGTERLAGIRAIRLTDLGVLTGIKQDLGELDPVVLGLGGKTVCFSAWFYVPSSSGADGAWRIEIYDGATTTYTEFEASGLTAATWTQISVVADIRAEPEDLAVRIYSVDGEEGRMYIDGACLNVGSRPMPGAGYGEKSAWSRERYVFQHAGELENDGYVGLWQPVVRLFYPTKLDVYCGRGAGEGPTPGTVEYILHSGTYGNGESAENLSCTLEAVGSPDADGQGGGSTQTLANASSDALEYGEYIRIYQDQTSTTDNPEDITVILTGWSVAT